MEVAQEQSEVGGVIVGVPSFLPKRREIRGVDREAHMQHLAHKDCHVACS